MLLDWGTRQADRARLPAFLESSPMGKPLYERMGFQAKEGKSRQINCLRDCHWLCVFGIAVVTWDLTHYGLEGTDYSTVMLREPIS